MFTDTAGKYRLQFKTDDGEIIATGQGYASRANAVAGIESIKINAPGAPIVP